MRTPRQQIRTAEAQWRRSPNAYQRPSATCCGTLFAWIGAWIADHFVLLFLIVLATAFAAGCFTGRLL